jgi:tripeptidyl-peptidase-1
MYSLSSLNLVTLALCASASAQFVLHNSRAAPPNGYINHGPAPASQIITLRVALTPSDIAGLEAKVLDISNPASANYAQWLSAGMYTIVFRSYTRLT